MKFLNKTINPILYFAFLIILLSSCATPQFPVKLPSVPPPPPKLLKEPRVALVLGAGGSRGFAHLGVLRALEEAHIPVDMIAGASAGSIVGVLYADNGSARQTYNIMMRSSFWDFADLISISTLGLVHGNNLQHFLLKNMRAKTFAELKKYTLIATTDINTAKEYTIRSGPIAPAVLASAALPGIVKPVNLYHHWLMDGGVVDPVPVNLVKPFHPKVIIAVNLSRLSAHAPTSALALYNKAYDIMWFRLVKYSLQGADVIINPDVGDAIFDFDKRQELYMMGYNETRKHIPEIKRLLRER